VPAPQNDRYEPLPGLLSLPSFLYRKLGPRGRVAAKLGGAIFVVAVTVAVIVLAPRIAESKRERAERERREAAAAQAAERRRLIAEQRPHHGRGGARASRDDLLFDLERAILVDARARTAAGKLHGPPAKRVECKSLARGAEAEGPRVAYDCIAITSDLPSIEGSPQGVLGHPFRAVVDYSTGGFTWCKVSGRPGEGSLTREGLDVTLPRACSR
jgi:type II secretory pathway pseudopilin PulG